jgi:hypothetical protein
MSGGGAKPAGSSRALRLDPLALPVRFRAADADADGRVRLVELYRDEVILRRTVRGLSMAVLLPISTFCGIAIRLMPPRGAEAGTVAVILEHADPALSVPLFAATETTDVLAEWRLWGRIFGLPLFAAADDGTLREAFACLGTVRVAAPSPRRGRSSTVRTRRPNFLTRRKPGRQERTARVHREREIIARN